jgi:hypothetical protein
MAWPLCDLYGGTVMNACGHPHHNHNCKERGLSERGHEKFVVCRPAMAGGGRAISRADVRPSAVPPRQLDLYRMPGYVVGRLSFSVGHFAKEHETFTLTSLVDAFCPSCVMTVPYTLIYTPNEELVNRI